MTVIVGKLSGNYCNRDNVVLKDILLCPNLYTSPDRDEDTKVEQIRYLIWNPKGKLPASV